jgi:hypothetical protein
MLATESVGRVMSLEAPHTSDPSLDAAMILFKAVVQVGAGPVPHRLPQHAADRPGVGATTVSGHPIRTKTHGRLGRAEEGPSGLHVTVLVEHGVDQVPVSVDRPIKVAPLAPDLQIRLVDITADARPPPQPVPALAQCIIHNRQQFRLSLADSPTADLDPAQQQEAAVQLGDPIQLATNA